MYNAGTAHKAETAHHSYGLRVSLSAFFSETLSSAIIMWIVPVRGTNPSTYPGFYLGGGRPKLDVFWDGGADPGWGALPTGDESVLGVRRIGLLGVLAFEIWEYQQEKTHRGRFNETSPFLILRELY